MNKKTLSLPPPIHPSAPATLNHLFFSLHCSEDELLVSPQGQKHGQEYILYTLETLDSNSSILFTKSLALVQVRVHNVHNSSNLSCQKYLYSSSVNSGPALTSQFFPFYQTVSS